MVIRVILHDHLNAVELFCRDNPSVVVCKRQGRKAQEQVSGLFEVFVDAVSRANQEHDISRKTGRERIGKLYRVHELAFFGEDDTSVFAMRELLFEEGGFLGERLGMVFEFRFLEFHDFERHHRPPQALHVLFDLVRY